MTEQNKQVAAPDEAALELIRSHTLSANQIAMRSWMRDAGQEVPDVPTLATHQIQALRNRLIKEELDEYFVACVAGDLTEVADAIADLYYVILGTAVAHGINMQAFFEAVHANNCEKLATGHRDAGGKFIKSPDHLPPDLNALLVAQWRASPFRADAKAVTCSMCDKQNMYHEYEQLNSLTGKIDNDDSEGQPNFYNLVVLCDGRRVKL